MPGMRKIKPRRYGMGGRIKKYGAGGKIKKYGMGGKIKKIK